MMFCPMCATQNLEDAKFCRSCGKDISLVPQAVTGQLAARLASAEEALHSGRGDKRPPSIERAVRSLFKGMALILIAFAVRLWTPGGSMWWFWLLLPAAILLADAVATYLRLAAEGKRDHARPYTGAQTSALPPRQASTLPPPGTSEMVPPSVTEATTRNLGVRAERPRRDV